MRLSEDPSTKVLVIEAGEHAPGSPGVQIPAMAGSTFKSAIDWVSSVALRLHLSALRANRGPLPPGPQDFHTVPQTYANKREVYIPRGKALGGSSVMNFMASQTTELTSRDSPGWN